MKNQSPFSSIITQYAKEEIPAFDDTLDSSKKYVNEIRGNDLNQIYIGWICERDSIFAYLYKKMKKDAKHSGSTTMAREIARAGFPQILKKIVQWVDQLDEPPIIIPVASRHGVSEAFADELAQDMLKKHGNNLATFEIFKKKDMRLEIKKICKWTDRKKAIKGTFLTNTDVSIRNKNVILVDDIISSGSSINESARILKELGAKKILGVVLSTNLYDSKDSH